MTTDPTIPRLVDIATAARELGTSIDAVRQRIRRGSLTAKKRDGRVYVDMTNVQVDAAQTAPERTGGQPAVASSEQPPRTGGRRTERVQPPVHPEMVAALQEQVAFLRAQVEEKDRQLEREQIASAELRRLLLAQTQGVLPPGPPTGTTATSAPPAAQEGPQRPVRLPRGFWERVRYLVQGQR